MLKVVLPEEKEERIVTDKVNPGGMLVQTRSSPLRIKICKDNLLPNCKVSCTERFFMAKCL